MTTNPVDARRRRASASERFEFRVRAETKQRISRAAAVLGVDTSDFVRDTVEERAEEVLADYDKRTVVPASFFDDLLVALDQPARPNDALRRALQGARETIKADHLHP